MLDSETFEKLQNASSEERITIIEVLLRSLKNDIEKNDSPQSESMDRPQRPAFGFIKDRGKILGDVVAPVLDMNAEIAALESRLDEIQAVKQGMMQKTSH